MYCRYFGLEEAPFSIAPNPHYLFMSPHHRDALAHLLYGVGAGGGFILLTGEVGTGKTTVTRCLLEQLPDNIDLAMVLNPALDSLELLATVCDELGIANDEGSRTLKVLTDKLHQFLLDNHRQGRNTVLLIDEAQHLKFDVLEQIRLLTNLETNTKKLLQIVLVGQPELSSILARPELRQLNQRITARYQIKPLSLEETHTYINHRLQVAGLPAGQQLFAPPVVKGIFRKTGGLPRLINVLCDRMLMGAYGQNRTSVDMPIFKQAAAEVLGEETRPAAGWRAAAVLAGAAVFIGLAGALWWQSSSDASAVAQAANFAQPAAPIAAESTAQLSAAVPAAAAGVAPLAEEPSALQIEPLALQKDLSVVLPQSSAGQEPTEFSETVETLVPTEVVAAADPWSSDQHQALASLGGILAGAPAVELDSCLVEGAAYRCERAVARTWDEFKSYNRPAVLTLATPAKMQVYAALAGIEGDKARLVSANGYRDLGLAELGELWTGQFLFVWKPPAAYQGPLGLWDSGAMVVWLARQFANLDNEDATLADDVYNRALEQRVKLFQQTVGLEADGIVGVNTLLRLNEALDVADSLQARFIEPMAADSLASKEAN